MHLASPDWLYHRLTISGPEDDLRAFRHAARGAGVIPWVIDYDGLEEDWFNRLVAQSHPARTAHLTARAIRNTWWEIHEHAVAAYGRSRDCPLDLIALVPMPLAVLGLGPWHPEAFAWLWQHWGTTWPLRHVRAVPAPQGWACTFYAADWTPWRALATIRARYPGLTFDLMVQYR